MDVHQCGNGALGVFGKIQIELRVIVVGRKIDNVGNNPIVVSQLHRPAGRLTDLGRGGNPRTGQDHDGSNKKKARTKGFGHFLLFQVDFILGRSNLQNRLLKSNP